MVALDARVHSHCILNVQNIKSQVRYFPLESERYDIDTRYSKWHVKRTLEAHTNHSSSHSHRMHFCWNVECNLSAFFFLICRCAKLLQVISWSRNLSLSLSSCIGFCLCQRKVEQISAHLIWLTYFCLLRFQNVQNKQSVSERKLSKR